MSIIILVVVCALFLGVGIYIYSANSKESFVVADKNVKLNIDLNNDTSPAARNGNKQKPAAVGISIGSFLKIKPNPSNLRTVIETAIADDVLTIDDRELIKQTAISRGFDYERVLEEVEKHVRFLEIDTDTKLVDLNEKNRVDFERLIVYKFCKVLFKIKEWSGDNYVEDEYSDNTPSPDLLVEFIGFEKSIDFAVKCKWRQRTTKKGVKLYSPEQLNQLKEYAKEKNVPVFIVLGLAGKGNAPERLFIIPLKNITKPFISLLQLNKYDKKVSANFYFDYVKKELK